MEDDYQSTWSFEVPAHKAIHIDFAIGNGTRLAQLARVSQELDGELVRNYNTGQMFNPDGGVTAKLGWAALSKDSTITVEASCFREGSWVPSKTNIEHVQMNEAGGEIRYDDAGENNQGPDYNFNDLIVTWRFADALGVGTEQYSGVVEA